MAAFALGYEPGPGEGEILARQEQCRKAPKDAGAYHELARAYLVRKRETGQARFFALAKDALSAARALRPGETEFRITGVQLLFSDHRFAEAVEDTRGILEAEPGHATAHLLLSDALLELGDYEGAVDALETAMDLSPDLRVYSRGSYLRWLYGDQEGALELMQDALRMGSSTAEAVAWCYVELGMLHWHAGDFDAATLAAQRALEQVKSYPRAIELMARVHTSRQETSLAIESYKSLLAARPSVSAHLALSDLLSAEGLAASATEQRELALEMAAHDPLGVALHDARLGLRPAKTLALAVKAHKERDNLYTRHVLALALVRAGQAKKAATVMGEVLEQGTLDASLWLYRGLVLKALGDTERAGEMLAKALEIRPSVDPLLVEELQATSKGNEK